MGGGVRQSIGYKEIRKLLLLIPPQTEQQKIANYCKDIIVEIGNNINHIEKSINLLQEYRTCLISDVVTGKVNVQNVKVPEFIVDNQEDQKITELNQEQ
jgi:type I restriction enzyme, S subunit